MVRKLILILLLATALHSQTFEKIAVTTGATVGYALLDVVLYPIAERNGAVNEYRMFQGAVITGITYALVKRYDYKTGASFLINVYCGVPDLVYYGFHPSEFKDELPHLKFLITASHVPKKRDLYSSVAIGIGFSAVLNSTSEQKKKRVNIPVYKSDL